MLRALSRFTIHDQRFLSQKEVSISASGFVGFLFGFLAQGLHRGLLY